MKLIEKNGKIQWKQSLENRIEELYARMSKKQAKNPEYKTREVHDIGSQTGKTAVTEMKGKTVCEIMSMLKKLPKDAVLTTDSEYIWSRNLYFFTVDEIRNEEIMKRARSQAESDLQYARSEIQHQRRKEYDEKKEYKRLKKKFEK